MEPQNRREQLYKIFGHQYVTLKSLLRCVGLIVPMIWMEQEWAWYVFLWLFLLTELHTLEINLTPSYMNRKPQRHWKPL